MTRSARSRTAFVISVLSVAVFAVALVRAQADSTAKRQSVWDGIYASAQAERGEKLFASECSVCHAKDMSGAPGVPSLAGPEFLFFWNGKTAADLFALMRTMPPERPESLTDAQYAEVLAAILKKNGFPAGDTELPAERDKLAAFGIAKDKP